MEMKLELVLLAADDLEVSKDFYMNKVGFHLDHDVEPGNGMRIIQLTPPGSACSVAFGTGLGSEESAPVKGTHLVVTDIAKARAELVGRGVEVGNVQDMGGVQFASFSDPAGNTWELQQIYSAS